MQRDFTASGPNDKCVADLTYIRTWNGVVYLALLQPQDRRLAKSELVEHEALEWTGFDNDERLHDALGDVPPADPKGIPLHVYRPNGRPQHANVT